MLHFKVDPSRAIHSMGELSERQAPFAVSRALNQLANKAQAAERDRLKSSFTLRRADWNLQGIYISKADRATKTSWVVVIQVQDSRNYLNKFEAGGERVPQFGRHAIAIPNSQVFKGGIVPKDSPLRPKALHLKKFGRAWRGDQGSFVAPMRKNSSEQGIFQRLGKTAKGRAKRNRAVKGREGADSNVRLLYTLVSRVPIKAKLEFAKTVEGVIQREWAPTMEASMADALKTAR